MELRVFLGDKFSYLIVIPMKKINVLIAENSYLIRKGFCSLVEQKEDFVMAGEVEKSEDLKSSLVRYSPDVLVIDYSSVYFGFEDIEMVKANFPEVKILAITNPPSKIAVSKALKCGVTAHLLKSCEIDEIVEAIYSASLGEKFMCEKIVALMLEEDKAVSSRTSCEGVKISEREIEILQLIADGLANKQIADKL